MKTDLFKIDKCPNCGGPIDGAAENEWSTLINGDLEIDITVCRRCGYSPVNVNVNAGEPENKPEFSAVPRAPKPRTGRWILFLMVLGFVALLLFLNVKFDGFVGEADAGRIIYYLLFFFLISGALFRARQLKTHIRNGVIWVCIFFVLVLGYSFRAELSFIGQRMVSNLVPGYGARQGTHSMNFSNASDGHFYIRARVNNVPVRFMVDTGASHIMLNPDTAGKLGFTPDKLTFDRYYGTANGSVRGASVRLSEIDMGPLILRDVAASVNEAPMRHCLLGMSFFSRMKSYKVEGGVLTITWFDEP